MVYDTVWTPFVVPVTVNAFAPVVVKDKLAGLKVNPVPLGVIVTAAADEMSTLRALLVTPLPMVPYTGSENVFAAPMVIGDEGGEVKCRTSIPLNA
jgi:hypothetical protein